MEESFEDLMEVVTQKERLLEKYTENEDNLRDVLTNHLVSEMHEEIIEGLVEFMVGSYRQNMLDFVIRCQTLTKLARRAQAGDLTEDQEAQLEGKLNGNSDNSCLKAGVVKLPEGLGEAIEKMMEVFTAQKSDGEPSEGSTKKQKLN